MKDKTFYIMSWAFLTIAFVALVLLFYGEWQSFILAFMSGVCADSLLTSITKEYKNYKDVKQ